MKRIRLWFVAAALLFAQSWALAHAVEHLRPDADASAQHVCAQCLAAQGLGAALAATPLALPPAVAPVALAPAAGLPVFPRRVGLRRARAPPLA